MFNAEPAIKDEAAFVKKDDVKKKVPERARRAFQSASERLKGQSMLATWAASGVILAMAIWGWWFFLPLTYGKPGLTVEQVNARKWLGYDLHFAK